MTAAYLLIWISLFPYARAMAGWDDFANNLATDLAPILQLFGEQVTLQYLAESTSVLDCIIFAMAPLGALTAVVSVIRICGDNALKAFIGRAQEGSGVAEVALCSSTGEDIADLYQRGVITRVFGRPHVLEVLHAPHNESFYTEHTTAPAGIYTFDQYQITSRGLHEWRKEGAPKIDQQTVHDNMDLLDLVEKRVAPEPIFNPNFRLNLGFHKPARWLLTGLAAFAVSLQSSVLIFAVWIALVRKLPLDS